MLKCALILSAGLISAAPVAAQAPEAASPQSANWDTLQKLYPPRALAAREEGAVGFRVTLDSKGDVTGCQVTRSSGHPLLDEETCNILTLHAVFKPDANVTGSRVATHDGVIAWKLPSSSTTEFAGPRNIAPDALDKTICKKIPKTGSLASYERTCMTARQWAKQSDDERALWDEMQGRKGSTHGN